MADPVSPRQQPAVPPPPSRLVWRFMVAYFDRYLRRHLDALRIARRGRPPALGKGPVVIYCNHPAWWDAAVIILLAAKLFPARASYAPFDARMLERYGVFRRMGAFGVDLDTRRGAAQFLAASRGILARPDSVMWVTAQGRFADVRVRPLGLRAGIGRLPELASDAVFVPLALEYAFWDERGASAFAAFGKPIAAGDLLALPRADRLARLEAELTATLDALSADVIAREPERFDDVIAGARGVGGIYDGWRRFGAALRGRRFEPGHRAARDAASETPPP